VSQADSQWKKVNFARQFENQLNSKEIQIFELGQIMISKITFDLA
jgi:hypothetical protein